MATATLSENSVVVVCLLMETIMTHSEAEVMMGKRDKRKLANNTYLFRKGKAFVVRLHETNVVTIRPDGRYRLKSGGWFTPTTRDRVTRFSPAHVYLQKGILYVSSKHKGRKDRVFEDGMMVDKHGRPIGKSPERSIEKAKSIVDKKVAEFIRAAEQNSLWQPVYRRISYPQSNENRLKSLWEDVVSMRRESFSEITMAAIGERFSNSAVIIWTQTVRHRTFGMQIALSNFFRKRKLGLAKLIEKGEISVEK